MIREGIRQTGLKFGASPKDSGRITANLLIWFLNSKDEPSGEIKQPFLSECREMNAFFQEKKVYPGSDAGNLHPPPERSLGGEIDLKHAYLHLPLHDILEPYLRRRKGDQAWDYQVAPFGLNIIPQVSQGLIGAFENTTPKEHSGVGISG